MKTYILLFALLLYSVLTHAKQTYFHAELGGFAPTLKIGFDRELNDRWDLKCGVGCFILDPSLISYNLFYSYKITNPEKKFNLNVNFGMLDSYYIYNEHVSFGFGIAPGIGWKTKKGGKVNFRLGFITGPAFEPDRKRWLTIPDFGLEYDFHWRKKAN
ncbi:MAG: hypothetical protein PF541_16780 [Prolixibacteraceae bacterium]|jgi:hypothetical protein|nr:hypothetical protein [Prolixibacteraceae bacterium]